MDKVVALFAHFQHFPIECVKTKKYWVKNIGLCTFLLLFKAYPDMCLSRDHVDTCIVDSTVGNSPPTSARSDKSAKSEISSAHLPVTAQQVLQELRDSEVEHVEGMSEFTGFFGLWVRLWAASSWISPDIKVVRRYWKT